ncbi:hypothetical protein LTR05_001468 [Lithohypha guttulata]|uniref:Uncharacterized protein n=1 Tax=Lithohypha guttulata TaxID=1690604 RepID=A0AAN7TH43_9EURO|nr:hypothetical protein LTR05_001468 [Lithohypha guttulata]
MDTLLIRFHRQYMQQISNLTYPPSKLLLEADVQHQLYKHFFDGPLKGPPAYQRKVLKQIISLIERAILDPEEDAVSDQLMEHMGYLSSLPQGDPSDQAYQTQIITYTLPEPLDASPPPPRILIEEAPNLLAAGSNVGFRTWEASLHLAQYLHSNPDLVHGKKIIELGAGTGLVSIICAGPLRADFVLGTDGLPHVVESLEKNIYRNRHLLVNANSERSNLVSKVLDWGDVDDLEDNLATDDGLPDYNLILGADITYSPDVVPVLAQLLKILIFDMFADTGLEALISATVRNGRTLSIFRKACEERGLSIENVDLRCSSVMEQKGFFHEQAFPIVLMRIRRL